jgi:hypothetical protein
MCGDGGDYGDLEFGLAAMAMPGGFDGASAADGGEIAQHRAICIWRATADEDGHYSFAVAL